MLHNFVLVVLEWFTKLLCIPFLVFFVMFPVSMFKGEEAAEDIAESFFGSWSQG